MDLYQEIEDTVVEYEQTIEAVVRGIFDKRYGGATNDKLIRSVTYSAIYAIANEIYENEN